METDKLRVDGRFWLDREERPFLGRGRVELLERIAACRSIAEAARQLGMGYKTAWDLVDAMNNLADQPLVTRVKGGRQGGGTQLTEYGCRVVATFRAMERDYAAMLAELKARYPDFETVRELDRRLRLRTSARNQLRGRVAGIEPGPLGVSVALELGGGAVLRAAVTPASVEALGLSEGSEAFALLKATAVQLAAVAPADAAQALRGRVLSVQAEAAGGSVEVTLGFGDGQVLSAAPAAEAFAALGLTEGAEAWALVDPAQVILAVAG